MPVKFQIQNRIRFLMKYDSKKNLLEQTPEVQLRSTDFAFKEEPLYPKICKYPERAIIPGKNEVGVSGLEAIPQGFCCYPIPMPESKSGGLSYIFLPQDATIEFWNEVSYNHLFKNILKLSEEESVKYVDYYQKIFPYGSVFSFDISGLTYVSWMQNERGSKFGQFDWFYTDNERKQPYPKVEWTDPRNQWDKIVDEYVNTAQWVAAAAFFISGFFTEGSTWLIAAEIATEGTLGLISAERNLEKGENVSAAFDLVFGATPFLKTTKFFTGIDQKVVSSLIRSMKRAGLSSNSSPEEIIRWYMTLGETEKKVWSKMVKAQDEFSEAKLKKALGEGIANLRSYIKSNPAVLKNVRWLQKVNVKEISLSVFISLMNLFTEIFYGEELNDEEKLRLASIYNNSAEVSQDLADELKLNTIRNADKSKEMLMSKTAKTFVKNLNNRAVKKSLEYINRQNKKMVEDVGGTWVEYEGDETKPLVNNQIDDETLKKLESEGYKREDLLTKEEWNVSSEPIEIKGTIYWKVKK